MQFTSYDFLPGQVTQTYPEAPSSSIKWDDEPFLRGLSEMVCDKCLLPRPGPGQALLKKCTTTSSFWKGLQVRIISVNRIQENCHHGVSLLEFSVLFQERKYLKNKYIFQATCNRLASFGPPFPWIVKPDGPVWHLTYIFSFCESHGLDSWFPSPAYPRIQLRSFWESTESPHLTQAAWITISKGVGSRGGVGEPSGKGFQGDRVVILGSPRQERCYRCWFSGGGCALTVCTDGVFSPLGSPVCH